MKKALTILMVLCCLFANLATGLAESGIPKYDENFSIRNGIYFGMDKKEVVEIERSQGNNESDLKELYYVNFGITVTEYNGSKKMYEKYNNTNKYIIDTMVAGQDGKAVYTFDKEGKMDSLRYLIENSTGATPLTDALVTKYGTPLYNEPVVPFDTKAYEYYEFSGQNSEVATSLKNYTGWLLEYNDIHVMVEAISFSVYDSGYGHYYYENITYSPISAELFLAYENKLKEAEQSLANDL